MTAVVRAAGVAGWLLAGLLLGVVGAFLQAARWQFLGITWPWGIVLMLALLVLLVRSSIEAWRARSAGWAVFVGWLAATIAFALEAPGGDLVISSGPRQLAYILGGVMLGSAAATIRPLLREERRPGIDSTL